MATSSGKSAPPAESVLIAPTADEWRAMSPEARHRLLVRILAALDEQRDLMAEGQPHLRAKRRAIDMLGLHFRTAGRIIYLAEELAVLYPGEKAFVPDILAVLDVAQPEEDERLAWAVAEEGKGLDFVLEILHHGDRNKDLVSNVERYARLGIPEYFVYDRERQQIHGYLLAGGRRYQRIVPQFGRYTSSVLGVDFAVERGGLRCFQGMAELFGKDDFIGRLKGMIDDTVARAEQARTEGLAGAREVLFAVMQERVIACPDDARDRIASCDDLATLQRWTLQALRAGTSAEVFQDEAAPPA